MIRLFNCELDTDFSKHRLAFIFRVMQSKNSALPSSLFTSIHGATRQTTRIVSSATLRTRLSTVLRHKPRSHIQVYLRHLADTIVIIST